MVSTRFNPLKKAGQSRKRRRQTSVGTRAKWIRKTPSANRSLIKQNARVIRQIKANMPPPVRCDWQQLNTLLCVASTDEFASTVTTTGRKLTNFSGWRPVLRESLIVNNKSSTTIYRMNMNIRYTLQASYWAQISFFIVTLRKDSSNRDFDGQQVLVEGQDYIANRVGADAVNVQSFQQNARLNPNVFKVHYARHVSMAQGGYLEEPAQIQQNDVVSNSFGTYRKGQVNLKMRMKVRNPVGNLAWGNVTFEQLPYYQKYYIITLVNQACEPNIDATEAVVINCDTMFSTINSG